MRPLVLCMLLGCGRLHFADLDDGGRIDAPPPTSCVTRIAAGHTHSCAIKLGLPYCWGTDAGGELGDGNANAMLQPTPMRALSGTGVIPYADIGVGGHWGCWLVENTGNVVCAGKNNHGQLGRGTMTPFETSAVSVSGLPSVVDLVVGAQHACAREANGALWCWGCAGYATNADCSVFGTTAVVLATNVTALLPGQRRGGCYEMGGALQCWGANEDGELGDGTVATSIVIGGAGPIQFAAAVQVVQGRRHACGRASDGAVACWGANNASQLGRGPTGPASDPFPATIAVPAAIDLVAGADHTCALTAAGDVWCWGSNTVGQLGVGDMTNRDVPTRVPIDGVAAIGAYGFGTCAARADGMYCWGSNSNGGLANGVVGPDSPNPGLSLLTCP